MLLTAHNIQPPLQILEILEPHYMIPSQIQEILEPHYRIPSQIHEILEPPLQDPFTDTGDIRAPITGSLHRYTRY